MSQAFAYPSPFIHAVTPYGFAGNPPPPPQSSPPFDACSRVLTLPQAFAVVDAAARDVDDQIMQRHLGFARSVGGVDALSIVAEAALHAALLGVRCELSMGFMLGAENELGCLEAAVREHLGVDPIDAQSGCGHHTHPVAAARRRCPRVRHAVPARPGRGPHVANGARRLQHPVEGREPMAGGRRGVRPPQLRGAPVTRHLLASSPDSITATGEIVIRHDDGSEDRWQVGQPEVRLEVAVSRAIATIDSECSFFDGPNVHVPPGDPAWFELAHAERAVQRATARLNAARIHLARARARYWKMVAELRFAVCFEHSWSRSMWRVYEKELVARNPVCRRAAADLNAWTLARQLLLDRRNVARSHRAAAADRFRSKLVQAGASPRRVGR